LRFEGEKGRGGLEGGREGVPAFSKAGEERIFPSFSGLLGDHRSKDGEVVVGCKGRGTPGDADRRNRRGREFGTEGLKGERGDLMNHAVHHAEARDSAAVVKALRKGTIRNDGTNKLAGTIMDVVKLLEIKLRCSHPNG
jgi:hypothetical protein